MSRLLLIAILLVLVFLILGDKLGRGRPASPAASPAPSAIGPLPGSSSPHAAVAAAGRADSPTPISPNGGEGEAPPVDRLARLAVRRRLRAEADYTYLDSLIANADSLVRRWPDLNGRRLRVAIVSDGPADFQPNMADFVREALSHWEETGAGIGFVTVDDTISADVTVRWIDHFSADKAGQTDLLWNQLGRIKHASISLAIHTAVGHRLPDAGLRAVALHEVGHAIGLPHSPDPSDAMYPSARATAPTERDRRTLALLYELPTGDIRDVPDSADSGVRPSTK